MSFEAWKYFQITNKQEAQIGLARGTLTAMHLNNRLTDETTKAIRSQNVLLGNTQEVLNGMRSDIRMENQTLQGIGAAIWAGNGILLGIAQILAKANSIDISSIFPEYFPKPPVPKPMMSSERITISQFRLSALALTVEKYKELLGEDRVAASIEKYEGLAPEQLRSIDTDGLVDTWIANILMRGKLAFSDFADAVKDYTNEQDAITKVLGNGVEYSRIEEWLDHINKEMWKNIGQIEPIKIDVNYGGIPGMDREVTAGFGLFPQARFSSSRSYLIGCTYDPIELRFGHSRNTVANFSPYMAIIDGELPENIDRLRLGGIPFAERLRVKAWVGRNNITWRPFSLFSDQEFGDMIDNVRYNQSDRSNPIKSKYGIKYIDRTSSVEVKDHLQKSQEIRMIEDALPYQLWEKFHGRRRIEEAFSEKKDKIVDRSPTDYSQWNKRWF